MSSTRLLSSLLVSGAFVLAAGAGLVAAGVSDEAARGQIAGQAGSAVVSPGAGGGEAPGAGSAPGSGVGAGTTSGLPFTGLAALPLVLVGGAMLVSGLAFRRRAAAY